jgi:hypothetical protein
MYADLPEFDCAYRGKQTYSRDWEIAPGNATESAIKFDWLWQLLGPNTTMAVPSLKAITWVSFALLVMNGAHLLRSLKCLSRRRESLRY